MMTPPPTLCLRFPGPRSKRLTWLLIALVLAPASALAGKRDEAKAHVARAEKAHKEGRYEEARVELEAAYAADPDPALLYAIGQVYAKLGNCHDASTYYKRFVATQKDPRVAELVNQAIAACKPAPEPGAEPVAGTASPPPEHPSPSPGPAPDGVPPAAPSQAPTGTAPPPPSAPPPPAPTTAAPTMVVRKQPAWYKDKLGDGLVLGGVAAAAVGLIEYRGAVSDLDTAEDRTQTTTLARYDQLVDGAHTKRIASIALVGASGALIAAGIVRYVLRGRDTEARSVALTPTQGGGVVTFAGRF